MADSQVFGKTSGGPLTASGKTRVERCFDNLAYERGSESVSPPGSGGVLPNSFEARDGVPTAPQADRDRARLEFLGNLTIVPPIRSTQHDAESQDNPVGK